MNKLKGVLSKCILFSLIVPFQFAYAEQSCINNAKEFENKKAEFPTGFQNLPIQLVADSVLVTAGIRIVNSGGRIKLQGHVWQPGKVYSDDAVVKRACTDGKAINITLDNGKTYKISAKNNSSVSISNISFVKANASAFQTEVAKVQGQLNRITTSNPGVR